MQKETKQLKDLIDKSKNILLLTHKGPDMDAFCSMLITYEILKTNWKNKNIVMKARQLPTNNIPRMKEIEIVKKIAPEDEDLIILLDTTNLDFASERVDTILQSKATLFSIDHHKQDELPKHPNINEERSSATEQVIFTFKEMLGKNFKITDNIAILGQYGIVADTGRFLYQQTSADTFQIFSELVRVRKLDLETIAYKQSKIPKESTPAIMEFLKTLTIKRDMSYMYIDKETIEKNKLTKQGVNQAKVFLRDRYLRHIQGVHWGFIISPGFEYENDWYIAFRSTKGYQDVKIIAEELGGGGHEYASGVPMTGNNAQEVLEKVLKAVYKHSNLQS